MRKAAFAGLALALSLVGFSPASAATKATLVTNAFKTLLTTTGNSLDLLEQKYEADIDALDAALANSKIAASGTYDQEIQAASNLYSPQISTSTQKVSLSRWNIPSL